MLPTIEDSWGMGDDRVRFKFKLRCLCKDEEKAEFVNIKYLYPEEADDIPSNVTAYECTECRTVVTFTTGSLNGGIAIESKTELEKNKDKPHSELLRKRTEEWYGKNVTKEKVVEEIEKQMERWEKIGWSV